MNVQSSSPFTGSFFMWKALTLQRENLNSNSKVSKSPAIGIISQHLPLLAQIRQIVRKRPQYIRYKQRTEKKKVIIVNKMTLFELQICIALSTSNSNESPGLLELTGV